MSQNKCGGYHHHDSKADLFEEEDSEEEEEEQQQCDDETMVVHPIVLKLCPITTTTNTAASVKRMDHHHRSSNSRVLSLTTGSDEERLLLNRASVYHVIAFLQTQQNPQIRHLCLICNFSNDGENAAATALVRSLWQGGGGKRRNNQQQQQHCMETLLLCGDWNDYTRKRSGLDNGTLLQCLSRAWWSLSSFLNNNKEEEDPSVPLVQNLHLEHYDFAHDASARQALGQLLKQPTQQEHAMHQNRNPPPRFCGSQLKLCFVQMGAHMTFLLEGLQQAPQRDTLESFSFRDIVWVEESNKDTAVAALLDALAECKALTELEIDMAGVEGEASMQSMTHWLSRSDCVLQRLELVEHIHHRRNPAPSSSLCFNATLLDILCRGQNWSLQHVASSSWGNNTTDITQRRLQPYLLRNQYWTRVEHLLCNDANSSLSCWSWAWSRLANLSDTMVHSSSSVLFQSLKSMAHKLPTKSRRCRPRQQGLKTGSAFLELEQQQASGAFIK